MVSPGVIVRKLLKTWIGENMKSEEYENVGFRMADFAKISNYRGGRKETSYTSMIWFLTA